MDNEGISVWKVLSRAATVAAIVGGLAGGLVTYFTQSRATEVRLLELGVQILQENPQGQNRALREWGISLLEKNAEDSLPRSLKESLRDSVSLPASANLFSRATGWTATAPITVDQQGKVTAHGVGQGTVTFKFGETADTSVVHIRPSDSIGRDTTPN